MSIRSFINGLLTGMVIGVLFAPRSGSETRKRLARRVDELKISVNKAYADFKDELSKEVTELANEEKMEIRDNMQDAGA